VLIASSSHEVVLIDIESGNTLFHHKYRGGVFEPHGVSSDGKLLIGGGYGMPQSLGAELDDLSVYYCPIDSYLDGTFHRKTRRLDVRDYLPLDKSPNLRFFIREVRDLGDGLFAVLGMVRHSNARSAKRTQHAIVFSASEHRVLASSNIDGESETIDHQADGRFTFAKVVKPKHRYDAREFVQRFRVPIEPKSSLGAGKPMEVAGKVIAIAPDQETFFSMGTHVPFLGNARMSRAIFLPSAADLARRVDIFDLVTAHFSPDNKLLAVAVRDGVIDPKQPNVPLLYYRPAGKVELFATHSGDHLTTIDLRSDSDGSASALGVCGFSPDCRLLITLDGALQPSGTKQGHRHENHRGFSLWYFETHPTTGD
jgi:hypothetical protein